MSRIRTYQIHSTLSNLHIISKRRTGTRRMSSSTRPYSRNSQHQAPTQNGRTRPSSRNTDAQGDPPTLENDPEDDRQRKAYSRTYGNAESSAQAHYPRVRSLSDYQQPFSGTNKEGQPSNTDGMTDTQRKLQALRAARESERLRTAQESEPDRNGDKNDVDIHVPSDTAGNSNAINNVPDGAPAEGRRLAYRTSRE